MNEFFRSSIDIVGEFTGLRTKDWDAARAAYYEDIRAGIARASGLVAMLALQKGDVETAQLERKVFLYGIAYPDEAHVPNTMTQRAAQQVLDELPPLTTSEH